MTAVFYVLIKKIFQDIIIEENKVNNMYECSSLCLFKKDVYVCMEMPCTQYLHKEFQKYKKLNDSAYLKEVASQLPLKDTHF